MDVRMPVTDSIADKPITERTHSSDYITVEVPELKSNFESLTEKSLK